MALVKSEGFANHFNVECKLMSQEFRSVSKTDSSVPQQGSHSVHVSILPALGPFMSRHPPPADFPSHMMCR